MLDQSAAHMQLMAKYAAREARENYDDGYYRAAVVWQRDAAAFAKETRRLMQLETEE